jgi:glycerophosphoryl diester phosphodiesterase
LDLPSAPWIVAHRGASGEAPENTLASLWLALAQGADLVEVDLWLSADGRLFAHHDAELDLGEGREVGVESLPLSEVQRAVADQKGVRVPTLEEILDDLPASCPLNLEIKQRVAEPDAIARTLSVALQKRPQVLLSSFDWTLLAHLSARLIWLPVAPLGKRDGEALLRAARELGAFSVHCHRRLADRRLISEAREMSKPVLVYTVNHPQQGRRLLARGARGLFTDFPGRMRRQLRGSNR